MKVEVGKKYIVTKPQELGYSGWIPSMREGEVTCKEIGVGLHYFGWIKVEEDDWWYRIGWLSEVPAAPVKNAFKVGAWYKIRPGFSGAGNVYKCVQTRIVDNSGECQAVLEGRYTRSRDWSSFCAVDEVEKSVEMEAPKCAVTPKPAFKVGSWYKVKPGFQGSGTYKCIETRDNGGSQAILDGRFSWRRWSDYFAVEEVPTPGWLDGNGVPLQVGDKLDLDMARVTADKKGCCENTECRKHPAMHENKLKAFAAKPFVKDLHNKDHYTLCFDALEMVNVDEWYYLPHWVKKVAKAVEPKATTKTVVRPKDEPMSKTEVTMEKSLAQQTFEKDVALAKLSVEKDKIAADEREKIRQEQQAEKVRQETKKAEEDFRLKLAKDAEAETKARQLMCKLQHKEMLRLEKRGDAARAEARKDSIYAAALKRKDDQVVAAHEQKMHVMQTKMQHEVTLDTAKQQTKRQFWEHALASSSGNSAMAWMAWYTAFSVVGLGFFASVATVLCYLGYIGVLHK